MSICWGQFQVTVRLPSSQKINKKTGFKASKEKFKNNTKVQLTLLQYLVLTRQLCWVTIMISSASKGSFMNFWAQSSDQAQQLRKKEKSLLNASTYGSFWLSTTRIGLRTFTKIRATWIYLSNKDFWTMIQAWDSSSNRQLSSFHLTLSLMGSQNHPQYFFCAFSSANF